MKKFFEKTFWFLLIMFLAWFGLSFIEVLIKNTSINPNYCFWNLFTLCM